MWEAGLGQSEAPYPPPLVASSWTQPQMIMLLKPSGHIRDATSLNTLYKLLGGSRASPDIFLWLLEKTFTCKFLCFLNLLTCRSGVAFLFFGFSLVFLCRASFRFYQWNAQALKPTVQQLRDRITWSSHLLSLSIFLHLSMKSGYSDFLG